MKVIAINGSPRKDGNTYTALASMRKIFEDEGIEYEIIHIGTKPVYNCIGCGQCRKSWDKKCIFKDDVLGENIDKITSADGLIFGTPVYYAGISGGMKSFMDRLFYSSASKLAFKPVAGLCSLRRSGGVETFNQLNNYFSLSRSIIVPTSYWSAFHGAAKGEVVQDLEGMDSAKEIAQNMCWLLKVLASTDVPLPPAMPKARTNFIR